MRGFQAPNSLPLWHQAQKRKLLVVVVIAITISIGLGLLAIVFLFLFLIMSWTRHFLTSIVKLNIIKGILLRHIVIPWIIDSRRSRKISRLTNWRLRKINFGHDFLLPFLQLKEFLIHVLPVLMDLLGVLATHVEASKNTLSNKIQLAFLAFGSLSPTLGRWSCR